MYEYEMDPTRTVGATERTRDVGRTDKQTDRRTDGVKPVYPPNNFVVQEYNHIMPVFWVGFPLHWPQRGMCSGFILCMCPANDSRRYNATLSLIRWAHTQSDPCVLHRQQKEAGTNHPPFFL